MKKKSLQLKIPVLALTAGLIIGFGASHIGSQKKEEVLQTKIKEASRQIALLQKRMMEEKTAATDSIEEKYRADLLMLRDENKSLEGQLRKSKERLQMLETKTRESDEAYAKARKESDEAIDRNKKKIQEMERNISRLDNELKKVTAEKQALQAELKETARDLERSEANNVRLCVIAEELVRKYREKGLGAILIEKEPLTKIGKVELEQLIDEYREKINQLRNPKK